MSEERYEKWIAENVTESLGTCREVTEAMRVAFPELRRVRGHYDCPVWGSRSHWWLVDADGSIVDPTASQFPSRGTGGYREWDESAEEPTGICMNCRAYVFDGDNFCSKSCYNEYMEDFGR